MWVKGVTEVGMGEAERDASGGWLRRGLKRILGLRGVGAATAVVSLALSGAALFSLVSDPFERRRQVSELVAIATSQLRARDYATSLATLDGASRVSGRDRRVRAAQEDVAMAWLQHVRVLGGQRFSDVVDPLVPILDRGVLAASGSRKADLIAHRGWAEYLRSRDVGVEGRPVEFYREALALDARNPYANAMWAHWILWRRNGGGLDSARGLFATAFAAGRARGFVRTLQLAILMDRARSHDGLDAALEMIKALDDARRHGEAIEPRIRTRTYSSAYWYFRTDAEKLLTVLPPAENLATYRWLFDNPEYAPPKGFTGQYFLARLQEAAGAMDAALESYRWLEANMPRCVMDCPPAPEIHAAIRRLAGPG